MDAEYEVPVPSAATTAEIWEGTKRGLGSVLFGFELMLTGNCRDLVVLQRFEPQNEVEDSNRIDKPANVLDHQ